MKTLTFNVAGRAARVNVLETRDDVPAFQDFVRRNRRELAFDNETSSTDIFKPDTVWRLAQFGTVDEAYVLPVENSPYLRDLVRRTLEYVQSLVMHNATFDILVANKYTGVSIDDLYLKTIDTGIITRLVDSRGQKEGMPGHKLEELTEKYVDPRVAKEVKGSMGALAKELKVSKKEVFKTVPLFHDGFNLYAGGDVILTSLVKRIALPKVPQSARKLIPYEHEIARVCAHIEKNGFLLDREYTETQAQRLQEIETFWVMQAEEELRQDTVLEGEVFYDLDDVDWGSNQQMARAFLDRGVTEFELTDKGQLKIDERFLNHWAKKGDRLAAALKEAKKATKWRKTWFEAFLANADENGRCHASINTMQARTGRMSITGIPAQTLPSGEAFVRNCFLADEGEVIVSIDYGNQELRVTAALSGDETMLRAFRDGLDLHQMTADAAGVSRKIGKMANFLTVYGGGWPALMQQADIDEGTAKKVLKAFKETYPGVEKLSQRLQKEAKKKGFITTGTGRRLYVDKERPYSAMNYLIQSTSRDVTCRGLLLLDEAGFTPHIRLPIHDEILFSFPEKHAKEMAAEAGRLMEYEINGLPIPTDPEIAGRSWGSIYDGDTKH